MHHVSPSFFSIRTILLIIISICAARSYAATFSVPGGLEEEASPGLQSTVLEGSFITVLENFIPGTNSNSDLDAILVLTERNFVEEVLGDIDLFILTEGPEINARKWLAFLAPETMSLELALQNSTIHLQSLDNSPPQPSPLGLQGALSPNNPQSEIPPLQMFLGIDLSNVSSLSIESSFDSTNDLPQFFASDLMSTNSGSIPEPTSTLLLFLGALSSLCRRKRNR